MIQFKPRPKFTFEFKPRITFNSKPESKCTVKYVLVRLHLCLDAGSKCNFKFHGFIFPVGAHGRRAPANWRLHVHMERDVNLDSALIVIYLLHLRMHLRTLSLHLHSHLPGSSLRSRACSSPSPNPGPRSGPNPDIRESHFECLQNLVQVQVHVRSRLLQVHVNSTAIFEVQVHLSGIQVG